MYAAAGGASLAGRKARQHGRPAAPPSPDPLHPAPTGVRAYSCQHWESLLYAPPPPAPPPVPEPHSPCEPVEFQSSLTATTNLASMQAALMLRSKSRDRRKARLKRGIKHDLPSNIATKQIAPFPRYPPTSWCAAGRAAWQEAAALSVGGGGLGAGGAARRCSVPGDHPGARRGGKWHRNNRVRDASYGSSSDSDGEAEGISGEPWGVARLLYAGLGILAVGLVVYFVGTGDKGFKTPALRLVGPSLIFSGLALCLLRIAFCIFAKPCCRRRTNYKENRRLSGCVEGEEMPLAGGTSRGPAQCSPARRLDASSCDVSSLSSGEEDERLRRYRTATQHTLHPPAQTIQVAPCQSASHNTVRQSPSPQSTLQPGSIPSPSQPTQGVQKPLPSAPQSALHGPSQRRPPPRNVSFANGPDGELVLSPAQLQS